jgi:hypothetical protein
MSIGQQVVSQLIDEKLQSLLQNRLEGILENASPGSSETFRPEIEAFIHLLYSYFTYHVAGKSPGMHAMALRYTGHQRRIVVYLLIILSYLHRRALKNASANTWRTLPGDDKRRHIAFLLIRLDSLIKLLSVLNRFAFLYSGRYMHSILRTFIE